MRKSDQIPWVTVAMPLQDFWQFFCKSGKIPSGNDGCIGNSSCAVFRELAKHGAKMDILHPTTCIQHAVICFVHVLFLLTFLIFLVSSSSVPPGALSSTELLQSFEFTSILYNVTAVLSALVGMVNLSLGLYILVMGSIIPMHPWLHLIVQGASWITIAISLRIRLRNQAKKIAYVWWIVTFLLASLAASLSIVDILRDATDFSPNVFVVIASWPVSCLLLACAIQGRKRIAVESEASIYEPLLNGEHQNGGSETEDTEETESATASFLSRMTFQWLFPLLATGYKQPLQLKDIPRLDQKREAKTACDAFLNAWEEQKKKNPTKPQSVFQALLTVYWRALFVNGLCALGKVFALALGPIILLLFINYEAGERLFQYEGYVLVAALFFGKMLESLFQRHWYAGARTIGMELRSGLVASIYQKQLRLSSLGRQRHATGEIVNYLSVDAYRLGEFPWYVHQIWTTPLQVIVASAILFYTVGWATVGGLAIIVITMICNTPLAHALQRSQVQLMQAQDERLRASTEILNSIKIIKLQAWEDNYCEKVMKIRQNEFYWLSSSLYKRSLGTILFWMTPVFVSTATFGAYILLGHQLSPAIVFTSLAAFRIVQDPVRVVPELLAIIIQVQVSLGRLSRFFQDNELQDKAVDQHHSEDYVVEIQDAVLSWDPLASKPTLPSINLKIMPGNHVAVCGSVGSGKSTLLYSIMGEIPKVSGSVKVSGSLAYVAQSAWIQAGTIQENVLFGLPMDKARYHQALKVCALDQDINSFPFGDQTEIGERGINMSGGQKQRIQLARAVYADADVYLLDDPFSALDAHTAADLFKDCIIGALKHKTVILVTHQVEFLPVVDIILVMEAGKIIQSGKYNELVEGGGAFKLLVEAHGDAMGSSYQSDVEEDEQELELEVAKLEKSRSQGSMMLRNLSRARSRQVSQQERESAAQGPTAQLTQQEEREVGDQGWAVYIKYIRTAHGWVVFFMGIVTQTIFVVGQMAANYWMATRVSDQSTSDILLIGVYSGLSILSGIFVFLRSQYNVALGLKASKSFFTQLIMCLFHAPMAFFDSTPMGRILSRISSDMTLLDIDVPVGFGFVSTVGLEILGVIVIIAIVTWQVLFVAIPLLIVVRWLQLFYLTSARELMRINGTTKAPIVNNFGETISGAMTIRAFGKVEQFTKKNLHLIDVDASLFFHTFMAYEWLVLRLETLCAIILCTTALFLVILPADSIDGGFAGLSLVYGLTLSGTLVFFIQYVCQLANNIVSVERICQYMDIPSEAPAIIKDHRPPANWPLEGKIDLQNLQIRYRPTSPLVLKGITCTFKGGQRIGVVGRTGSGKTTLISALFRLVEPAGCKILIDNLDITSIGLHDLRAQLGIIPQEPTLFRGTVRTNMDPLEEHLDIEIWEALDKCQLSENIRNIPEKLDAPVSDEGGNWSVGQRQLFCLGRAVLKHSRILVLDEATASIDSTTDTILQKLIREGFKNRTVITVAHRIPTVADSDMILSMTDGVMAEYDTPLKLLENSHTLFAKLVAEYWKNTHHF